MTRYERLEASRVSRGGRDTTLAVRIDRAAGDGARMALEHLAAPARKATGMRALIDGGFRAAMRRKIGRSA